MIGKTLIACALLGAAVAPAHAQGGEGGPVAVVVTVPTPAGAPRAMIEEGMRKSVDTYRRVPGLLRKYFTIGDGVFGGVYLFTDRPAAQAWFNDAWRARIQSTYRATATVTYFAAPIVLDNAPVPDAAIAGK